MLSQTLQEQGIAGEAATLSLTYVPINLFTAMCYARGTYPMETMTMLDMLEWEGLTEIQGTTIPDYVNHLPTSLEHLNA